MNAGESTVFDSLRKMSWRRSRRRWLGGCCGAIANRTGIDVALIRGIVVFITVFFAWWILPLAYAVGWLLLPDEDGEIILEDLMHGRFSANQLGFAVLAVVAVIASGITALAFSTIISVDPALWVWLSICLVGMVIVVALFTVAWLVSHRRASRFAGAAYPPYPAAGWPQSAPQTGTWYQTQPTGQPAGGWPQTPGQPPATFPMPPAASPNPAQTGQPISSPAAAATPGSPSTPPGPSPQAMPSQTVPLQSVPPQSGTQPGPQSGSLPNQPRPNASVPTYATAPPSPRYSTYSTGYAYPTASQKPTLSSVPGLVALGGLLLILALLISFGVYIDFRAKTFATIGIAFFGLSAIVVGVILAYAAIRGKKGGWLTVFSIVASLFLSPVLFLALFALAENSSTEFWDNRGSIAYSDIIILGNTTFDYTSDSIRADASTVTIDLTDAPADLAKPITVYLVDSDVRLLVREGQCYSVNYQPDTIAVGFVFDFDNPDGLYLSGQTTNSPVYEGVFAPTIPLESLAATESNFAGIQVEVGGDHSNLTIEIVSDEDSSDAAQSGAGSATSDDAN